MATNSSYSYLDRLLVEIPEYLYSKLPTVVDPKIVTLAIVVAIAVITVGLAVSFSISKPKNAKLADPKLPLFHPTDLDFSKYVITTKAEAELGDVTLKWYQVAAIPVATSLVLIMLYILMKAAPETVNWIMNFTFLVYLPTAAVFSLDSIIAVLQRKLSKFVTFKRYRLAIVEANDMPFGWMDTETELKQEEVHKTYPDYVTVWAAPSKLMSVPITNLVTDGRGLVVFPLSLIITYLYYVKNPVLLPGLNENWLLSNSVLFCCTVCGIILIQIAKFSHLVSFLSALFFYDIFFVFRTPMMETVAKGLQVPIKFVVIQSGSLIDDQSFLLIGTGDLVLPGLFICFLSRFDFYKYYQAHPSECFHHARRIPRDYFNLGLFLYFLGLVQTMIAVHGFNRAQPALLYIVPTLILGTFCQAYFKGDWKSIWSFDDEIEMKPQGEYEVEDDDYEPDDLFDEWMERVEEKRDLLIETDEDTEADALVYQFLELSDEDDDTFIIGDDDSDDEVIDDDSPEELIADLVEIKRELQYPPQEWYSDDE